MAMSFHQFRKLPTELRLEIWRFCLPNRVIELDIPAAHIIALDADQADYCCGSSHTSLINRRHNRRPPVISRVCRESRMVALEHVNLFPGGFLLSCSLVDFPYFGTSMGIEDWVDKRRDVLHIHYWQAYDADWPRGGGDLVRFWLSEAAKRARLASITLELFCSLPWEPAHLDLFRNQSLLLCLRVVSLHAPLQPALDSGLFGLLGDARVVFVDAADPEQKEQYRAFWEAHGTGRAADTHPARFFAEFCKQGGDDDDAWVRAAVEEMEIQWMLEQWYASRDGMAGADADAVWSKIPTGWEDWPEQVQNWRNYVPNREHWWTKATLEAMPKLRPVVMFRLCTQRCPENIPFIPPSFAR
ncbi:hypothetical protein GE09DRAFT_734898 [Coniochaeta sp. 2T2.1]|nr:hypothetical protein GE09DRAFT_734898 [Coniochaeta sp. 2T2.1]